MSIGLSVLCICAVAFLLRVLVALVKEGMRSAPLAAKFHFARFNPSQRRREVVVMRPIAQKREFPARDREWMAL